MLQSMILRRAPLAGVLLALTVVYAIPQTPSVETTLSTTTPSPPAATTTITSTTLGTAETTVTSTASAGNGQGESSVSTDSITSMTVTTTGTIGVVLTTTGTGPTSVSTTSTLSGQVTSVPPSASSPPAPNTPLPSPVMACNNSPLLCGRRYNEVTYLGAHNSPFLRNRDTRFSLDGSQHFNTTVALSAGVRLLHAEVHFELGDLILCHTSCHLMNAGSFSDWLSSIKSWLDANPNEVVTLMLLNADGVEVQLFQDSLSRANLLSHTYSPPFASASKTASWPTLAEMIARNTRLVTFIDNYHHVSGPFALDEVSYPYLLDQWEYVFETPADAMSPDFVCDLNRPATSPPTSTRDALGRGMLPLLNHVGNNVIVGPAVMPGEVGVDDNNSPAEGDREAPALGRHARRCGAEWGVKPVFVMVDFWDRGPALEAVDRINGVDGSVRGRVEPPAEDQRPGEPDGGSTLAGTVGSAARLGLFVFTVAVMVLY